MQTLRRYHSISRFFFGSSQKFEPIKCNQRRKMPDFLKGLYFQNLDNIYSLLPKADLKFASLVAYNITHFNIKDKKLEDRLNTTIKEQIHTLTPDLAYELALNLRDIDNPEIFHDIYMYCQRYFYLFDEMQLKIIEDIFSSFGLQLAFDTPTFENPETRAQISIGTKENTGIILESLGIQIPQDELDIIIHPFQKITEVFFKKTQKSLKLMGLCHEDWGSLFRARDLIYKNDFDFFLLELPPITRYDIFSNIQQQQQNNTTMNKKKKNKNKTSIIDRFIPDDIPSEEEATPRSPYHDYFDRYDRIALFDKPLLKWYTNNILLRNDVYKIMEAETVVYSENSGLKKPNELETIMYLLSRNSKDNVKVLLSDLRVYDEICLIANSMSLSETKDLFKYARYLWFNEVVRWGLSVNKRGCINCTKNNSDPPTDVLNLLSHQRYNFGLREQFITNQIINAIEQYDNHKNYVGFYGEDHIFEILRYLCQHYSNNPSNTSLPSGLTEEQKFKNFLRFEDLKTSLDLNHNTNKAENTNKFSMLMSLYEMNRSKKIETPNNAHLDWELYEELKKEYLKFLSLDSFVVDISDFWKTQKQESKCYAVNLMLH